MKKENYNQRNGISSLMVLWICYLYCFPAPLFCQSGMLDSLRQLLNEALPDSQYISINTAIGFQLQEEDPEAGIKHYHQFIDWSEAHKNIEAEFTAINGLAACYYYKGDLVNAEKYWNDLLKKAEIKKDTIEIGKGLANLGMVYETKGDLDSAIKAYNTANELWEKFDKPVFLAINQNNIGLVHEKRGDYYKAQDYFFQALKGFEIAESQGSFSAAKRAIGSVFTNLGMVNHKIRDYQKALEFYRKSVQISRSISNNVSLSIGYNNMGGVYERLDLPDSSLYYHNLSLDLKMELGDSNGIAASYNNIGILHAKQGHYDLARWYQEKCLAIATAKNYPSELARASADLGGALLKMGDLSNAERHLKKAHQLSDEVGESENKLKASKFLYELYKKTGSPLAFQYVEEYMALNDSLHNNEKTSAVARMQSKFEFEKEKQIIGAQHEKEQLELQMVVQRQKQTQTFLAFGMVLFLLFLGALYYGYHQKKLANFKLEEKNKVIQENLAEKEVLLREIHHRVKNNLQVISSLLGIQSRGISDATAISAIEEGRNRVMAMALIHQNLYQESNFMGVNLKAYLEKLVDNLVMTYTVENKKIELQYHVAPITLDVDLLVPLGLVINELISNALKYAFKNKGNGLIEIFLEKQSEKLLFILKDNGTGFTPSDVEQPLKTSGIGFGLINALVQKMKGELQFINNNGTTAQLTIPYLS